MIQPVFNLITYGEGDASDDTNDTGCDDHDDNTDEEKEQDDDDHHGYSVHETC